MIDSRELLAAANKFGLRPDVIEKDYILGWLLSGIYNDPILSATWLFKGGTCLKKCWFDTYRFSEDLDFTILKAEHLHPLFYMNDFQSLVLGS